MTALDDDVDMEHLTGGVSVGMSGDVSALALELSKKGRRRRAAPTGQSLSGVSIGKLGVGEKALLSITAYPGPGEASGKAAVEIEPRSLSGSPSDTRWQTGPTPTPSRPNSWWTRWGRPSSVWC